MSETVIQLKGVSRVYGSGDIAVNALQDVTCELHQSDFVCIVGPSGCGKSTLLHLIGGLDAPSEGKVYVEHQDLSELNPNQLSDLRLFRIGFVFQAFNLIPVLTALENVEFVLQLQRVDSNTRRERAMVALKSVGLEDAANRKPSELSGGQQQRVAIARALVGNPLLLVADEPSANLDAAATRELCELLQHINDQQKVTILIATHDPLVMGYGSRRIHLEDGRIQLDEKP